MDTQTVSDQRYLMRRHWKLVGYFKRNSPGEQKIMRDHGGNQLFHEAHTTRGKTGTEKASLSLRTVEIDKKATVKFHGWCGASVK